MIDLRVLGALEVQANRAGGTSGVLTQPKRLALLVYLALAEPAGLQPRDGLLALLWPEADDASARHSLRNALHALRQVLGDEAIVTRGEAYVGLDLTAVRCDALDLRSHLAAGRADDALVLWRGDLAPGFHVAGAPDFERWLEQRRVELRRAVRAAACRRARELEGTGTAEVDALRRAIRLDPSDEPATRRLIHLLDAAGDRGGALRAYQELVAYFAEELETEPSLETQALAAGIRSSSVSAPRATPTAAAVTPTVVTSSPPIASPRTRRRAALVSMAAGAVATIAFLAARGEPYFSRHGPAASPPETEAERAVLRLPARYRADTAAYSSYLRGLTLRFQFRFTASRDTLAALVERNPLYAPALAGLAHAYIFALLNNQTEANEAWPKVSALARRAIALDSTAASPWLALASEDMFERVDLRAAGERIARARRLDSLDPDVAGMRSVWFRFHGAMDSAVAEAELAHRLDPLSPLFAHLVGKQLYFARRYEESRVVFAQMLADDPGWKRGYEDFAEVFRALNRPRDAVTWYRRARAANGDLAAAGALLPAATDSAATGLLAADARRTIIRFDRTVRAGHTVPASQYAVAHAALRDTLATLHWLDSMLTRHDTYLHHIRVDPRFDFLRGDPRYHAWEARTGLPPISR